MTPVSCHAGSADSGWGWLAADAVPGGGRVQAGGQAGHQRAARRGAFEPEQRPGPLRRPAAPGRAGQLGQQPHRGRAHRALAVIQRRLQELLVGGGQPAGQHQQQLRPVIPGFAFPARHQQVPGRGRVDITERGQVADPLAPAAGLPHLRSVRRVRPGGTGHDPLPVGAVRGQPAAPVAQHAGHRGAQRPIPHGRVEQRRQQRGGRPVTGRTGRGQQVGQQPGIRLAGPAEQHGGPGRQFRCGVRGRRLGAADLRLGPPPGPPGHGQQHGRVQHAGRRVVGIQHTGVAGRRASQAGDRLGSAGHPDGGRRDQVVIAQPGHSRTA